MARRCACSGRRNDGFNLSAWALKSRSFVIYLMIVVLSPAASFFTLGRNEDPAFTIKTMVVRPPGRARRSKTR